MPKFIEEYCYLTEKDIITNMKNIFGYDSPYFAKMIYLLLSEGYDKAKISMSKFIKEFIILKGEDLHSLFNTLAFRLYDIDRDNLLNVMNLVHLQMNVPPSSLVGKEIFQYDFFFALSNNFLFCRIIASYFTENIKSKSTRRKQEVNLDVFNKIIKHSVIVDVSVF